jgi:hypothetical protein
VRQLLALVVEAMAHGQGALEIRTLEVRFVREDHDELPLHLQIGPQRFEQGAGTGRFETSGGLGEGRSDFQGRPGRGLPLAAMDGPQAPRGEG